MISFWCVAKRHKFHIVFVQPESPTNCWKVYYSILCGLLSLLNQLFVSQKYAGNFSSPVEVGNNNRSFSLLSRFLLFLFFPIFLHETQQQFLLIPQVSLLISVKPTSAIILLETKRTVLILYIKQYLFFCNKNVHLFS